MVAGLTLGLPLPVVNSPVKQIRESLELWCPAHPLHGCLWTISLDVSVSAKSALVSSSVSSHPPWVQSPAVADNPDILGALSLIWVASPSSELCVFILSIQHCCVYPSKVFHLFFPEDVLLTRSACGKNFIAQWITALSVWNLEPVLEIKKTVYLPLFLARTTVIVVLNSFSSWQCKSTELSV